ncbi:MAG: radical SAM protein [Desulfobacteraceae bacterium]|jgi:uncharacterized protein
MDIRYLIIALTTRCNLNCAYCYNGKIEKPGDMPPGTIEKALNLIKEGEGPCHIQLTGGEPSLVPDLVKHAVSYARNLKRPCTIGLQTNGTMLDLDMLLFLKKQNVQIGVSLDGPPVVQEKLRGQAADTYKGLQFLESLNIPFRITTVLSGKNIDHLTSLVTLLAGYNMARGIGFDLLVDKGKGESIESANADSLKRNIASIMKTLEYFNRLRNHPIVIRELELLKNSSAHKRVINSFCHACNGESLYVLPDGTLYPCGQTMGDTNFASGNLHEATYLKTVALGEYKLQSDQCEDCILSERCPGECPSRIHYNGNGRNNLTCVLYQALWEAFTGQ